MNDDVRQGRTQQDYKNDVADASHGSAATNIIAGKRRENAATWMRGSHGLASPMRGICSGFKPKELDKVAQKNAYGQKYLMGRAVGMDTSSRRHIAPQSLVTEQGWRLTQAVQRRVGVAGEDTCSPKVPRVKVNKANG